MIYIQCFDLDKPMDWRTFNRLPVAKQKEYLSTMKRKYGATNFQLGKMFRCSRETVALRCRTLQVKENLRNHKAWPEQESTWEAFLNLRKGKPNSTLYETIFRNIPHTEVSWQT